PKAYEDGQPPNGTGFVHRGVAAWRDAADGDKLRIFINSRYHLICLDGATGTPVDSFGTHGVFDLSKGLVWEINKTHYTNTSPPRPASASGTRSSCITASGTTTTRRRRTWSQSTSTAAPSTPSCS